MAGNDVLGQVAPASNGSLALVAHDCQIPLVALLGVDIQNDGENDDRTQMTHALLGNSQNLLSVGAELDTLDCGGEVPGLQQAAGLDFPESHGVVGATTRDYGGSGIDVDGPDGALVSLVGAETFAIVCIPDTDLLVLGHGEKEVAVGIESTRSWLEGYPVAG